MRHDHAVARLEEADAGHEHVRPLGGIVPPDPTRSLVCVPEYTRRPPSRRRPRRSAGPPAACPGPRTESVGLPTLRRRSAHNLGHRLERSDQRLATTHAHGTMQVLQEVILRAPRERRPRSAPPSVAQRPASSGQPADRWVPSARGRVTHRDRGTPWIARADNSGSLRLSHWTGTAWPNDNFGLQVRSGTSPSAYLG